MKSKSLLLLAVAGMCGLVAMLGVQRLLTANRSRAANTVKVLVAKTDIEPGIRLDKTNVGFKEVPVELVPKDAVSKEEDYAERALKLPMFTGQVILKPQLGDKGVFGATIQIPAGMRVTTVKVDASQVHSGLLKPGDHVDVTVTYKINRPKQGTISRTKTILQAVKVYGIDDQLVGTATEDGKGGKDSKKNAAKTVSFLVWPNQSNILQLAAAKGTLQFPLRGKLDDEDVKTSDIDDRQLEQLSAEFLGENELTAELIADEQAEEEKRKQREQEERERQEQANAQKSFAEFLQAQPGEATPAEAPVKTWKVSIFNGSEKQVHEFPMPEETDASADVTQTPATTSSSFNWMGAVRSLVAPKSSNRPVTPVRSSQRERTDGQAHSQN